MKEDDGFPFDEDDFEWDEEKVNEENDELNFITKRESDTPTLSIMYVDFRYDEPQEETNVDLDNPLTRENETYEQLIGPEVFSKNVELGDDFISDDEVKEKFIEKVIELSERNFNGNQVELYEKFKFTPSATEGNNTSGSGTERRKLIAKINMGSSAIAVNGRIGPAQYMIISEDNFHRYGLSDIVGYIKPIFYETHDIILFRKNSFDQPGLVYITNDDKYSLVDIGFYPQKQFLKIKIENES